MNKKKLQIEQTEIKLVETDLEYPQYFYFQSEGWCMDTLVMVKADEAIIVEYDIDSLSIRSDKNYKVAPHYLEKNLTSKEHFMEAYLEARKYMDNVIEI